MKEIIDGILEADRQAPRKQRHTAHRIWTRLRRRASGAPDRRTDRAAVCGGNGSGSWGSSGREVFVPQSYELGQEGAGGLVRSRGEAGRRSAQAAVLRDAQHGVGRRVSPGLYATPRSRHCWKRTSTRFAYFGGVFRTLRYDNLRVAVKKILRGYQREETDRMIAFRSHWGFRASTATRPGATRKAAWKANWAGSGATVWCRFRKPAIWRVERTVAGSVRGQPQPHDQRQEHDRRARPAQMERPHLLPLAEEGFPIDEILYPAGRGRQGPREGEDELVLGAAVAGLARDGAWSGRRVIEIEHDGKCVARHQRCYGRGHQILELEHYLDVLEKKPGAMAGSTPLQQWRQAGRWPAVSGPDLAATGAAARQEQRHQRDDRAGAGRTQPMDGTG